MSDYRNGDNNDSTNITIDSNRNNYNISININYMPLLGELI